MTPKQQEQFDKAQIEHNRVGDLLLMLGTVFKKARDQGSTLGDY